MRAQLLAETMSGSALHLLVLASVLVSAQLLAETMSGSGVGPR